MDFDHDKLTLEKMFIGTSINYRVPDYQRSYAWKQEHIEQLWEDVINAYNDQNEEYFMGTIVLNSEDHSDDQFDIVDGQQRLATFAILFKVVYSISDFFTDNYNNLVYSSIKSSPENKQLSKRVSAISRERLYHISEPDHYYLTLNQTDHLVFENIVAKESRPLITDEDLLVKTNESKLIKTKKYFSRKIIETFIKEKTTFEDLYRFVMFLNKKIIMIAIKVKTDYDAYVLFESLNSTGLDLSTADLLKNKLLMACGSNKNKKKKVLNNWNNISAELEASKYSVVDFLRFYWIAYHENETKKRLYKAIKKKIDTKVLDPEKFTTDLLDKSKIFAEFTDKESRRWPSPSYKYDSIENDLSEMNTLGYTLCYPLLIYAKSKNVKFFNELTKMALNYLFRLISVGDYSVGKAEKTFTEALKLIKKGKNKDEVLAVFIDTVIGDAKFKEVFASKTFTSNTLVRYILSKIHMETENAETLPNGAELHVEHVLPQDTQNWSSFDSQGRNIDEWIYNIGNLVLVKDKINQSASNKKFQDKITVYKEKGSRFPMTMKICNSYDEGETEWTVDMICKRSKEFSDLAEIIWQIKMT